MIRSANFAPGSPAALVAARAQGKDKRSADAKRRAHNGGVFEEVADRLHAECLRAGIADVERVASNLKAIKSLGGGHVEAVMTKDSCLDCRGWFLRADGGPARAITVEIKGVSFELDERRRPLPVSFPLSQVKPHQVEMLDRAVAQGVCTILLVIYGAPPLSTAYAVPWAEVRKSGLRTLSEEFLRPWRVGREPYLKRFLSEVSK